MRIDDVQPKDTLMFTITFVPFTTLMPDQNFNKVITFKKNHFYFINYNLLKNKVIKDLMLCL